MRIAHRRFVLLASAFCVAAVSFEPPAAQAAAKKAGGGRDAAIEQCMAKTDAEQPRGIPGSGAPERRTAIYKDCMKQAGFRP